MVATLIGFLFFLAIVMALGTIAGMTLTYGNKAMAALRLEHVPAASLRHEAAYPYSPARRPRFTAVDALQVGKARHRRAHAA